MTLAAVATALAALVVTILAQAAWSSVLEWMNSKQDPREQYNIEGALNRYMTPAHIERYHEAIESRFSQETFRTSSLWFAPVCRSKNFWRGHKVCDDCGKCSHCKNYPYGRTQQIEITPTLEEIFQASLAIAEQTQQEIAREEPDFVPLVRTVPQEEILDFVPLVRTVPQDEIIDYNPPLIIRSVPSSEFWYYGDTEYRGELFVEDNVTYMNQEPRYDYLNNGIWIGSDGNYYYKELDSIDSNNPASMLFKPSDIIGSSGENSLFNACQRLDDGERGNGIICGYPVIPVNKDDHLLVQPITDLEISSIISTPIPSPDEWENLDPGFTVVDLGVQICTTDILKEKIDRNSMPCKTIEDILIDAEPLVNDNKRSKSKLNQYSKSGGYTNALRDFEALDIHDKKEFFNPDGTHKGFAGKLPDGTSVNVRNKSTEGSPTIEIQRAAPNEIKIRYQ